MNTCLVELRMVLLLVGVLTALGRCQLEAAQAETNDISNLFGSSFTGVYEGTVNGESDLAKLEFTPGLFKATFQDTVNGWKYVMRSDGLYLTEYGYGDSYVELHENYRSSGLKLLPKAVTTGVPYSSSCPYDGNNPDLKLTYSGTNFLTATVVGVEMLSVGGHQVQTLKVNWTQTYLEAGQGIDTDGKPYEYGASGSETTTWWLSAGIGIVKSDYQSQEVYTNVNSCIINPNPLQYGLCTNTGNSAENGNFSLRPGELVNVLKVARLVALEVNQVVQDWQNSVPLVKDKKTIVRAFLEPLSGGNPVSVDGAHLRAFKPDHTELAKSPLPPINGPIYSQPDIHKHRADLNASLNFELPAEWIGEADLELRFEWPTGCLIGAEYVEKTAGGKANDCTTLCKFEAIPDLSVRFNLLDFTESSTQQHFTAANYDILDLSERLKAIFPVARINPKALATDVTGILSASGAGFTYDRKINPNGPSNAFSQTQVIINLASINRQLDLGLNSAKDSGWLTLNLLPDAPYIGLAGLAVYPTSTSPLTFSRTRVATVLALANAPLYVSATEGLDPFVAFDTRRHDHSHELGHLLGQDHPIPTSYPHIPIPNFPYLESAVCSGTTFANSLRVPDAFFDEKTYSTISPADPLKDAINAVYGLDTSRGNDFRVMSRSQNYELMSYCFSPEKWISSFTYSNILQKLKQGQASSFLPPANAFSGAAFAIKGTVNFASNSATVDPMFRTDVSNVASNTNGAYTVILRGGGGIALATTPFEPDFPVFESSSLPGSNDFAGRFSVVLPYFSNAASLEIWHSNQLIGVKVASSNAPLVHLDSPNGGENFKNQQVNVRWTGSDADNNQLTYAVQFSGDGGASWETLISNWGQTNYLVGSNRLGGTLSGRFRVIASDGFRSASDDSDGLFSVDNHPPNLSISSPVEGKILFSNRAVSLNAFVQDIEDGLLSGTNVTWFSSRDGVLGTGATLSLNVSTLSSGAHTIMVSAKDSGGLTNSTSVQIVVTNGAPPVPPIVSYQPGSDALEIGSTGFLFVGAQGTGPFSYQWQFNGVAIPGATSSFLMLTNLATNQIGKYSVVVSNSAGVTTSSEAEITVYQPSAPAADYRWSLQSGGSLSPFSNSVTSVAADASNNVFITGSFTGVLDFGGVKLTNTGEPDVFIAKYSSNGVLAWVRQAGGPGSASGDAIAVDQAGNCHVTGSFIGTADFGGIHLTNRYTNGDQQVNFFLAKYDPLGNALWVRRTTGSGPDYGTKLAVDTNGNVFAGGSFGGSPNFLGTVLTNTPTDDLNYTVREDVFLSKFDSNGNLLWVRSAGGPGWETVQGLSVADSGNVLIAGGFEGKAMFGALSVTNGLTVPDAFHQSDGYVAKYSSQGNVLWVRRLAGGQYGEPTGVAADGSGNSYVVGPLTGVAAFDGTTLTNRLGPGGHGTDIYVAKLSPGGGLLWVRQFGGSNSYDFPNGVSLGADGGCIVTGSFEKIAAMGDSLLTSAGLDDLFTLRLDLNGNVTQLKRSGSVATDRGRSVAVGPAGGVYTAGEFAIQFWPAPEFHLLLACEDFGAISNRPPLVSTQPLDRTATLDETVVFETASAGAAPLGHAWFKDDLLLSNQSGATLSIYVNSLSDAGRYRLQVTNNSGLVSSREAILVVSNNVRFTNIKRTGEQTTVQFSAAPYRTYSVLWSDSLTNGPWNKLADIPSLYYSRVETVLDSNPSPARRFYRIVTPQTAGLALLNGYSTGLGFGNKSTSPDSTAIDRTQETVNQYLYSHSNRLHWLRPMIGKPSSP